MLVLSVYSVHTYSALCVNYLHTLSDLCVYSVHTFSALCVYSAHTLLLCVCTQRTLKESALCVYSVHSFRAECADSVQTSVLCVCTQCTLKCRVCTQFTLLVLYVCTHHTLLLTVQCNQQSYRVSAYHTQWFLRLMHKSWQARRFEPLERATIDDSPSIRLPAQCRITSAGEVCQWPPPSRLPPCELSHNGPEVRNRGRQQFAI